MKKILCALLLCVFISPCVWGEGQPTQKCYEWIKDGDKETSFLQVFYDYAKYSEFPKVDDKDCKEKVLEALRGKGILNDSNKLIKSLPIMIMAGESRDSNSDTISQGRMDHIADFVNELNSDEITVSVSKSLALGKKDASLDRCGRYSDCAKDRRVIIIFGLFDNLQEVERVVKQEMGLNFDINPWKNIFVDVTQVNKIFDKYLLYSERSVWKTADGKFNTARLLSDSIAGVVLGTAGGLITANVVKKNQIEEGFEDLRCTIGGQAVADWGDEFSVGRI